MVRAREPDQAVYKQVYPGETTVSGDGLAGLVLVVPHGRRAAWALLLLLHR